MVTGGHGRAAAGLLAATLALGGCALLRKPPPPPPPPAVQHHPLPTHTPKPTPPTGSAAAAGRLGHPPLKPLQVVGLSQDQVRRLLGQPAAERSEGAGQTWTYQGTGCRVDIAFYYDVTRNGFFALSARQAGGGNGGDCLARIHDAETS